MIFSLPKADNGGVRVTHSSPANRVGEYFCDNETNSLWVYLRAERAISRGVPVNSLAPVRYSAGLEAAAVGSRRLTFSVDLTTPFFNGTAERIPERPQHCEYLIIYDVENNQMGTVWARQGLRALNVEWWSEDNLSLGTALAANDDVHFNAPWLVRPADGNAPPHGAVGIAQADVPSGHYFWALVEGVGVGLAAAAIDVTGTSLAVHDAGDGLEPLAAADLLTLNVCAYALTGTTPGSGVTVADGDEFPIIAAVPTRISIPPFTGGRSNPAYQHPAVST